MEKDEKMKQRARTPFHTKKRVSFPNIELMMNNRFAAALRKAAHSGGKRVAQSNRKPFLYKMFVSYLITVFIPVAVISVMYYYHLSKEKKEEFEKYALTDLQYLMSQTRMVVDNIDNLAVQFSMNPNLNEKLMNPFVYDIYDFQQLKETIRNQISTNRLIYSLYVFFKLNDKVLTTGEGFYRRAEFYDKAFIDGIASRGPAANPNDYEVRRLHRNMDPEVDVISFAKPLPLTSKDALGYLVVNVKKDVFFEILGKMAGADLSNVYIVRGDTGETVYESQPGAIRASIGGIPAASASGSRVVTDERGEQHLVTYVKSRFNSWIYVMDAPYSAYQQGMDVKKWEVLRIAMLVTVLGLIASYMLSLRMYRPWKRIVRENEQIKLAMEQNKPIIKHRLIYMLLNDHVVDTELIRTQLLQAGLHFAYEYFAVLIVVPNYQEEKDSQLSLMVFSIVENALPELVWAAGTMLEHGQLGFILNIGQADFDQDLKMKMTEHFNGINAMLQTELGISVQFAVGGCHFHYAGISQSYLEAKRVIACKALINKNDIVFMQEMEADARLEYPLHIQKELAGHLIAANAELAESTVDAFFKQYIYSRYDSRERLLETILMLLSNTIHELYQQGYDTTIGMNLLDISKCPNNEELHRFISRYVHMLATRLGDQLDKTGDNVYVAKAVEYIESHFHSVISIADIADYVGLSSSYLSRIFKMETGKPPLEYLTRLRIARSKELLAVSRYSLQEISGLVGYQDAHSFIRFFKKYEGITPGEFRKKLLKNKSPLPDEQTGG